MSSKKVAVITGGSKGIGKAIALKLGSLQETHICIVSRSEENLKKAILEIQNVSPLDHISIACDVSSPGSEKQVFETVFQKFGRVDILVNNSGGPPPGSFLEKSELDWNMAIANNFMSVIRFSKYISPFFIQQKWGRILNITSTLAKEPSPSMVLSASVRAGVSAFTKAIAEELAIYNITVNTICPGSVLTERLDSLVSEVAERKQISREEQLEKSQSIIPMKRFASPSELAEVGAFLVSDAASYITGQSLMVDGGLTKSYF